MKTIEIWPDGVEGGDAVGEGAAFAYLLFTDSRTDTEIAVMMQPEVEQRLLEQLDAWVRSRFAGRDNPN